MATYPDDWGWQPSSMAARKLAYRAMLKRFNVINVAMGPMEAADYRYVIHGRWPWTMKTSKA